MCQSAWASAALIILLSFWQRIGVKLPAGGDGAFVLSPGGINVLLTQESMTPVDNSKVCPVSSLSRYARVVLWPRCKLEEQRQKQLRGWALAAPGHLKQKQIRGLILRRACTADLTEVCSACCGTPLCKQSWAWWALHLYLRRSRDLHLNWLSVVGQGVQSETREQKTTLIDSY